MANIHDCLQTAMDAGEIDTERGTRAQQEYDQLLARLQTEMPRAQAEVAAADALKEASRASALSRRHKVLAQLQAMHRIKQAVEKSNEPGKVLLRMIEWSPDAQSIGYTGESIKSLQEALIRSVNGEIGNTLRATARTITGKSSDPAMTRNIIRELHGQKTGNVKAAELASAVAKQRERLRKMFNANGGNIGKLDDYGVMHSHNAKKLKRAGFEPWARSILDELDWARITNHKTGKPFGDGTSAPRFEDVEEFLKEIHTGITTNKWDRTDPSMSTGGRALYNQRAEKRILHFKDGDAWMRYNEEFGASDPFTAMVGGLHGMARDVALMRVLGPNPNMGLEFAAQVARKKAAMSDNPNLADVTEANTKLAKSMLSYVDSSVNVPQNAAWAAFLGGTRQVLTSIQLGSAPLSAVTDIVTIRMASQVSGMNPNNVIARSLKLMASSEAREMAASAGYIADSLADMGAAQARYTGDAYSPEVASRIAGATMRASGLAFWTDMNRVAFQMEFAAMLGNNAGKAFDQLHPQLKSLFEQRGITPNDWDLLRDEASLFRPKKGAVFISPNHWREHTSIDRAEAEGLSTRLQMLMDEQMEFAVPTSNVEMRAQIMGETKPGTIIGEIARSFGMYKGFALSLTINQIRRIQNLDPSINRAQYAMKLSAGLLVMGGLAIQLKEIAKGNDPRPMDEPKFWMGALFQGGGLGIFGDFFSSETSRAGGGIPETIAGPVGGLIGDIVRPVSSNIARVVAGDDPLISRDLANFQRYNTPVLSSLWYGRLAYDRLVSDEVQRLLDPDAESLWRRAERRRLKDYGTRTWWERGENFPERAPDLSNALGDN